MFKYLGKVNAEMKKLDKLYIDGKIKKEEYLERLEYLKECANHLEHEKRMNKRK